MGTGCLLVLRVPKRTGIAVEPVSAEERLRLKPYWARSGGCKPEVCGEEGSGGRAAVLEGRSSGVSRDRSGEGNAMKSPVCLACWC